MSAAHQPDGHDQGWREVRGLLDVDEIGSIQERCRTLLRSAEDHVAGDKPHGGTRHLVLLDQRIPLVREIIERRSLLAEVHQILGQCLEPIQVSYRSPQPGFGAQKLHTDDLPKLDEDPDRVATAIVALVDFTAANGATRVLPGSHRRPDLQRLAGNLDNHHDELLLTGAAGTAFVFSGHLLHSGTRNRSDKPRPALQLQWRRC